MGRECSIKDRTINVYSFFLSLTARDLLEGVGVDGKIILKMKLEYTIL